MPIVIETYREFAERHGNDAVCVGQKLIFGDGAKCNCEGNERTEPPTSPTALLKLRKMYVAEALKHARVRFQRTSQVLNDQCNMAVRYGSVPPPSPRDVEELERQRDSVTQLRAQLEEVEQQLERTPEAIRRREREEDHRTTQAQAVSIAQQVRSITLDGA